MYLLRADGLVLRGNGIRLPESVAAHLNPVSFALSLVGKQAREAHYEGAFQMVDPVRALREPVGGAGYPQLLALRHAPLRSDAGNDCARGARFCQPGISSGRVPRACRERFLRGRSLPLAAGGAREAAA